MAMKYESNSLKVHRATVINPQKFLPAAGRTDFEYQYV